MSGEVVGGKCAYLVLDFLAFTINTPFCFICWQSLLVNEQAKAAVIDSGILEIAPVVLPSLLSWKNQTHMSVWALQALIVVILCIRSNPHETLSAVDFSGINRCGKNVASCSCFAQGASVRCFVEVIAWLTRGVLALSMNIAWLKTIASDASRASRSTILGMFSTCHKLCAFRARSGFCLLCGR